MSHVLFLLFLDLLPSRLSYSSDLFLRGCTRELDAVKAARPVCAVRRFEISLSQTGRTREVRSRDEWRPSREARTYLKDVPRDYLRRATFRVTECPYESWESRP